MKELTLIYFSIAKAFDSEQEAQRWAKDIVQVVGENSKVVRHTSTKSRFLIKSGNKFVFKEIKDIAYFFAEGKYVYLVSKDLSKYLVDYTIEALEKKLDCKTFFRVKRNLIVNIDSIKEFITCNGGRLRLILSPKLDHEVIVGREKAVEFKRWVDCEYK